MPKHTLSFETVGNLDEGSLRIEFNRMLTSIFNDLNNRPRLEKKRSLTLKVELKPRVDDQSDGQGLDDAETSWSIDISLPPVSSSGTIMKPQQNGQLYFHSELPDSPDDETIEDEIRRNRGDQP